MFTILSDVICQKVDFVKLISKAVVLDGYVFLIVVVSEYTIVD